MAHDVFISYSHQDKAVADAVCATLENRKIRCWIAPRDVAPGSPYATALVNAINKCKIFVLILSKESNTSGQVLREVEEAVSNGTPILPLRIEDIEPTDAMRYYIKALHWLDAMTPPLEKHLGKLADSVQAILAVGDKDQPSPISPVARLPQKFGHEVLTINSPFHLELVLIPAGEFLVGSDPIKDPDAMKNEQPQHSLYLPDYYISKTPITNDQYAAFVEVGQSPPEYWEEGIPPMTKEDHPVIGISWFDANSYCRWLSAVTAKNFSLPSEAAWEKASRGEDGRIYPWGNEWDAWRCNANKGQEGETTPVCSYSPHGDSPYGIADMAGNVSEWTSSLYKAYPYDPKDGREDPDIKGNRVLRGGAFSSDSRYVRCATRYGPHPRSDPRSRKYGFRVAFH